MKSSFSHYNGDANGTVECIEFYAWHETTATAGSAIFMRSSNATIELSKFEGNRGEIGGAIYTSDSDTLIIINCTFEESIVNINLCHIVDFGGGALYARDTTNVTLIDSNFTEGFVAVSVFSEQQQQLLSLTVNLMETVLSMVELYEFTLIQQ